MRTINGKPISDTGDHLRKSHRRTRLVHNELFREQVIRDEHEAECTHVVQEEEWRTKKQAEIDEWTSHTTQEDNNG